MIVKPQLDRDEPLPFDRLAVYIDDDGFAFEQKIDGHRLVAHIDNGHVVLVNKRGEVVSWAPQLTDALSLCSGQLVFDGEWDPATKTYWPFDLPKASTHIGVTDPYQWRREVLEGLFRAWTDRPAMIHLLPRHSDSASKSELVRRVREKRCEGVMVKKNDAPYTPGRRNDDVVKAKLTATIDAVVTEVGRKGKASLAVGVYESGEPRPTDIGAVTMIRGMAGIVVGDVIEVRYRHASPGDRRLVEPVFLRCRSDKAPEECTIDQLVYPCKEVLT